MDISYPYHDTSIMSDEPYISIRVGRQK